MFGAVLGGLSLGAGVVGVYTRTDNSAVEMMFGVVLFFVAAVLVCFVPSSYLMLVLFGTFSFYTNILVYITTHEFLCGESVRILP